MADPAPLTLREPTSADVDRAVQIAMEMACPIGLRRELAQLLAGPEIDVDDLPDSIVDEAAERAISALWGKLEADHAARRAELGPIRKPRAKRKRA